MFEIGPSLREARERRGLGYTQVELDTAIRSRYVRALEEEDFGILPGPTYTKGFLRAYADYLGLDGQLYVDEFNSRHHDPRREFDQPIASRPRSRPQQQRRRRRESQIVMIALATIVAITSIIFLVALKRPANTAPRLTTQQTVTTNTPGSSSQGSTGGASSQQSSTGSSTSTKTKKHTATHPTFTVSMTATDKCWITANTGSSSGKEVSSTQGTGLGGYMIDPAVDATVAFTSKWPVVITVGAPGSITISVNGKVTPLPAGAGAGTPMTVTSKGLTVG